MSAGIVNLGFIKKCLRYKKSAGENIMKPNFSNENIVFLKRTRNICLFALLANVLCLCGELAIAHKADFIDLLMSVLCVGITIFAIHNNKMLDKLMEGETIC